MSFGLPQMLCEQRGFFLEIADIIRGLGLTILKGVMETKNEKIWARFAVEVNTSFTLICCPNCLLVCPKTFPLPSTPSNERCLHYMLQANRDITRMEIFISLVHLLEQTTKNGVETPNGTDNEAMKAHQFHQAASVPTASSLHWWSTMARTACVWIYVKSELSDRPSCLPWLTSLQVDPLGGPNVNSLCSCI